MFSASKQSLTGEASSKCFVMAIWCFELKYWLQSVAIHYNYPPFGVAPYWEDVLPTKWVSSWSTIHESHRCVLSHPWVLSMTWVQFMSQYIFMILSVCLIYESRFCIPSANHINNDMVEVNGLTTSKLPGSFLHKGKSKYLGNHSNMCMIIC